MSRPLPTPTPPRPLPELDPYAHPKGYVRFLAEIFHAEVAALRGFENMGDPTLVCHSDLFLKARTLLMRQEVEHMKDLEALIGLLGASEVPAPLAGTSKLWEKWGKADSKYPLPMPASVAACFMLFSEGLGYALLYTLATHTTDARFRAKLMSNIEDEKGHLRVSMNILSQALEREGAGAIYTILLNLGLYATDYRLAAHTLKAVLEGVGWDYYTVTATNMRFIREVLLQVAEESGVRLGDVERWAWDRVADAIASPAAMRIGFRSGALLESSYLSTSLLNLVRLDHWWTTRKEARSG